MGCLTGTGSSVQHPHDGFSPSPHSHVPIKLTRTAWGHMEADRAVVGQALCVCCSDGCSAWHGRGMRRQGRAREVPTPHRHQGRAPMAKRGAETWVHRCTVAVDLPHEIGFIWIRLASTSKRQRAPLDSCHSAAIYCYITEMNEQTAFVTLFQPLRAEFMIDKFDHTGALSRPKESMMKRATPLMPTCHMNCGIVQAPCTSSAACLPCTHCRAGH